MHDRIKQRINSLLEYIGKAAKMEDDLLIIEELMPDAYIWLDHEINVDWPVKSITDVKEVLRNFAKQGVMLDHFVESETNPLWYLKGKKSSIRLNPSWHSGDDNGATCKLVKIGEKTTTEPIYKLVCSEKEMLKEGVPN